MRRVIVETPYQSDIDIELNLKYLRACLADSFSRGEAPFASHGLYTQPGVLDDSDPIQRSFGISAGNGWREVAQATIVYTDLGFSPGMTAGIRDAERLIDDRRILNNPVDHVIEYRTLGGVWPPLNCWGRIFRGC